MWSEGEPVRSARLADWLSVSRPTVTVALRRMTRDGMVRLNARKEVELTAKGRRLAAAIVRRHRIMERWLTDGLGLDWVTADEEAARLEHAVSGVVEKRLDGVLGRPGTCQHGNPIPGYSVAAPNELRLTNLDPGARASITRVVGSGRARGAPPARLPAQAGADTWQRGRSGRGGRCRPHDPGPRRKVRGHGEPRHSRQAVGGSVVIERHGAGGRVR
jgi:Mn-dependent DtxR family transcriptional regulator